MSCDTRTMPAMSLGVSRDHRTIQRLLLLALVAAVVLLDQATKWWAWRHLASSSMINPGGSRLVGATIGAWYTGQVMGPVLDVVDLAVLCSGTYVLVRRRRPVTVLVTGALMAGGWWSNLLDRLVMHDVTAPGSVRGAVDFLAFAGDYYNLADIVIAAATPLFLLAVGVTGWRAIGPSRAPLVHETYHPNV